ncbi:MAG: NAD(P)H-dependent oxidoreductase [Patescibacteria group bacterium]|jgi:putative NADPH-quinone reductase
MKISIILGHPTKGSFNHAIANTAKKFFEDRGDEIFFHDLYEDNFVPSLPTNEIPKDGKLDPLVQQYCDEISVSDGIIIVHPNWWAMPPAILKGWVDRIIRPGIAYGFKEGDDGEGIPIGLLKANGSVVVFNTSNTPANREQNYFGDPLENIWKTCIFDLCGIKKFHRKMYGMICTSTDEQRKAWLKDVQDTLNKAFSKKPQSKNSI